MYVREETRKVVRQEDNDTIIRIQKKKKKGIEPTSSVCDEIRNFSTKPLGDFCQTRAVRSADPLSNVPVRPNATYMTEEGGGGRNR